MGVGAAAATFGLISGVLVGGPLGRRLIVKYDLKPEEHQANYDDIKSVNAAGKEPLSALDVIKNVVVIIVCMALGTMVSGWVSKLIGMSFPNYVGAMFVAVIVRNLNDTFHFYKFSFPLVDGIGDVMLNLVPGSGPDDAEAVGAGQPDGRRASHRHLPGGVHRYGVLLRDLPHPGQEL